jgi:hypothetical protein
MILRAALSVLIIALVVGIHPAPAQSYEVLAWLECEECTDGELDALLDLAHRDRAKAVRELTSALMRGPGNRVALLEGLGRRYHQIRAFVLDHPDVRFPLDSLRYLRDYSTAYIALYQSRAAYGLARIGGPDIGPVLDSAATVSTNRDVTEAIQLARDSVLAP